MLELLRMFPVYIKFEWHLVLFKNNRRTTVQIWIWTSVALNFWTLVGCMCVIVSFCPHKADIRFELGLSSLLAGHLANKVQWLNETALDVVEMGFFNLVINLGEHFAPASKPIPNLSLCGWTKFECDLICHQVTWHTRRFQKCFLIMWTNLVCGIT